MAVHARNDGHGQGAHREDGRVYVLANGLGDIEVCDVAGAGRREVCARAEGVARARENQDPRAVVRRLPDGGEERLHRLAVNRVAPLGAVDGDALDAVLKCDEQFLRTVGHRYYSLPK